MDEDKDTGKEKKKQRINRRVRRMQLLLTNQITDTLLELSTTQNEYYKQSSAYKIPASTRFQPVGVCSFTFNITPGSKAAGAWR